MGREEDCRRHAGEAMRLAEAAADWPMQAVARGGARLLELGRGRLDAAVDAWSWSSAYAAQPAAGRGRLA